MSADLNREHRHYHTLSSCRGIGLYLWCLPGPIGAEGLLDSYVLMLDLHSIEWGIDKTGPAVIPPRTSLIASLVSILSFPQHLHFLGTYATAATIFTLIFSTLLTSAGDFDLGILNPTPLAVRLKNTNMLIK
jgi:hypothetical protein